MNFKQLAPNDQAFGPTTEFIKALNSSLFDKVTPSAIAVKAKIQRKRQKRIITDDED